jgi:type II secretory pathway pseudopilin PulG
VSRRASRGFNLLELLLAVCLGLALMTAFLVVLQRSRQNFDANESLAQVHDAARQALQVIATDVEHAGFFGFGPADGVQLVRGGSVLAEDAGLAQPLPGTPATPVAGLPAGAHDCGVNFAVDLVRAVQGSDNTYRIGHGARDCEPTASAGAASPTSDTLTLRHASLQVSEPRAGRLQLYTSALSSRGPLRLFADGHSPGPIDDAHEVRDLEIRTYYVANDSVQRPGWPALRVKSLSESRGAVQFRDEEVMPGVEDLQVQLDVESEQDGARVRRQVDVDSAGALTGRVVALHLWLRIRADHTERGFHDDRTLDYANVSFTPDAGAAGQRRLLVSRSIMLRNQAGS